ncbi:UNVERIFIED_CONTAM: hypothetical protein FKN15_046465, partial [Acipenser sinensis]
LPLFPGEQYSNPLAPDNHEVEDYLSALQSKLTNEDFRKLLMTPWATPSSASPSKSRHHEACLDKLTDGSLYPLECQGSTMKMRTQLPGGGRRKATFCAKLRQQELERERELAEKYRDRARERRDGVNKDYEETELISTTANYRAVGPTAEADKSAAEKRRQLIQESKFLGGDMEHTHLVKGLDFALLQKGMDSLYHLMLTIKQDRKDEDPEQKIEFKTRLGRHIYRIVFKSRQYERNELFLSGRMAYVVDLEDEYADTDSPTTLIRSKADCPTMEAQTTLTTNDIVISKLTQILSYLRQGTRNKKMKKKEKGKLDEKKPPEADLGCFIMFTVCCTSSIFDDIGEYVPSTSKAIREKEKERYQEVLDIEKGTKREEKKHLGDFFGMFNSYAECYPAIMDDLAVDSDDEVDYSKMDQGNKKGPLGRWDFDTQEEYSDYMNNKEALPKAAFQYCIKMSEGRKTCRFKETNEKAELDRQWMKISAAETEASGTATLPPSGQVAASQGIPSQPSQSLTQTLAHLAEEVFTNAPRERSGSTPSLTSSTSVAMTLFKRRASLQSILDPLPCMGKTRGPLEVLLDTALEDMGIPLDAVSQKSANSSNSTDGNGQRRLSVITPQDKAVPHVPRGPEQVPPDLPCGELNSPNNSTYCAYKDGAFLDEAAQELDTITTTRRAQTLIKDFVILDIRTLGKDKACAEWRIAGLQDVKME